MKIRIALAALALAVCASAGATTRPAPRPTVPPTAPPPTAPPIPTFTLFLNDGVEGGTFYGPGNTGEHRLPAQAQVRNLVFTGPLTGIIPFFNNGSQTPNVLAEILQGGVVDGRTSNGIPFNENIDTGLMLDLKEPSTGESAKIMVVAVAQENVTTDEKRNLMFNPSVIADPGTPQLAVPFQVTFTTGARRIPLSRRTQMGLPGGHDNAGPFVSGHVLIGRIGDFNQDGFLDGVLVQAENSPLELVVAWGDPIAQIRPWSSDIPVQPELAALLTLNGTVNNYPEPLLEAVAEDRLYSANAYVEDILTNIDSAIGNIRQALHRHERGERHSSSRDTLKQAKKLLKAARRDFIDGAEALDRRREHSAARELKQAFEKTGMALQALASLGLLN